MFLDLSVVVRSKELCSWPDGGQRKEHIIRVAKHKLKSSQEWILPMWALLYIVICSCTIASGLCSCWTDVSLRLLSHHISVWAFGSFCSQALQCLAFYCLKGLILFLDNWFSPYSLFCCWWCVYTSLFLPPSPFMWKEALPKPWMSDVLAAPVLAERWKFVTILKYYVPGCWVFASIELLAGLTVLLL